MVTKCGGKCVTIYAVYYNFTDVGMLVYRGEKENERAGDGLGSHRATPAVGSALAGLTTGFEMGPGVPPPL